MHLLDRHHAVADGTRIRLRLPQIGDRHELRAFLDGLGVEDLDVRRALRWAPRAGRWSVVATRWDGTREAIAGIAVVDGDDGAPTLLAADPQVAGLLAQALADRAEAARRRAA
jgi:hypothetical protein